MKKFIIGNHLTLYLLLACALLAGILAIESHNLLRPEAGNSGNTANAVTPASQARFNPPAMATFSEITERPLFNQSRKPPVPEQKTTVVKAAPKSPLRLQLEGVAITSESRLAVVRDRNTNTVLHLAPGEKHEGWELISVSDKIATFKRGEQTQQLELE